jgi:D-3-phosphoglycerate dehydrogenase / 2-oxoglutarate reductase
MTKQIAIIGDRFMLPEIFRAKIVAAIGSEPSIRMLEQPWPDKPMEHGYGRVGLEGLKEYMGDPDEIVEFVAEAEMFVTHLAPLSKSMLERLPNLRFVAVSRGGPVNIDIEAARARGLRVVNTPGRNASAVAEFTIGAILSETRLIRLGHESLRAGDWRGDLYRADVTGRELSEMTVGVIGYGAIGTRVVRLLKAFGPRILVCDPYVQLSAQDHLDGVQQTDLDMLLAQSDVVSLHARVTEETTRFINAQSFARMKNNAIFVNTARGDAGNVCGRTGAARLAPLEAPECDTDPAYCRSLRPNGYLCSRTNSGGSSPLYFW